MIAHSLRLVPQVVSLHAFYALHALRIVAPQVVSGLIHLCSITFTHLGAETEQAGAPDAALDVAQAGAAAWEGRGRSRSEQPRTAVAPSSCAALEAAQELLGLSALEKALTERSVQAGGISMSGIVSVQVAI